jgi:hypothetical protein
MTEWTIFYSDESTFEYRELTRAIPDERVRSAPVFGVIAVVQKLNDEMHPQMLKQCDYYVWMDGMWWGCSDIVGLVDKTSEGASWTKQGRTIRTALYRQIEGAASHLVNNWE